MEFQTLHAPCLSHHCSLCHCFPSRLACSERATFWDTVASVPLGQGSDPSWTPSMLPSMGARQRGQGSCTQTAPPWTYPEMALQIALPCNQQLHRPALFHAHAPAASSACLTPSVFLLHPSYLSNLPPTWNNWEFARITTSSAQPTDRNKTRNVTCLQSQEVDTVDASLRLRASLTAPITKGLPFPFLSRQGLSSCHKC